MGVGVGIYLVKCPHPRWICESFSLFTSKGTTFQKIRYWMLTLRCIRTAIKLRNLLALERGNPRICNHRLAIPSIDSDLLCNPHDQWAPLAHQKWKRQNHRVFFPVLRLCHVPAKGGRCYSFVDQANISNFYAGVLSWYMGPQSSNEVGPMFTSKSGNLSLFEVYKLNRQAFLVA